MHAYLYSVDPDAFNQLCEHARVALDRAPRATHDSVPAIGVGGGGGGVIHVMDTKGQRGVLHCVLQFVPIGSSFLASFSKEGQINIHMIVKIQELQTTTPRPYSAVVFVWTL